MCRRYFVFKPWTPEFISSLLTNSQTYNTFLESTENYTLQIQCKIRSCLFTTSSSPYFLCHRVPHVPESPRPRIPTFSRLASSSSHVLAFHVPKSQVLSFTSNVPLPLTQSPIFLRFSLRISPVEMSKELRQKSSSRISHLHAWLVQ